MRYVDNKLEEAQAKEKVKKIISERKRRASALMEEWVKRGDVGEALDELYTEDKSKAENLVIRLDNQEKYFQELTETQISTSFNATPENVARIITRGYPNSVRGEIFLDWAMETARDSIYYMDSVRGTALRSADAESSVLEAQDYDYPTEEVTLALSDDTGGNYSADVAFTIIPFKVSILEVGANGAYKQIAADDGAGNIVGTGVTGSVDYSGAGADAVQISYGAGGATLKVVVSVNTEDSANYDQVGDIKLVLRDYQFQPRPMPLYISWSKMTELLLGTTLKIDSEDALIRGAGNELKRAIDFGAVAKGWEVANRNIANLVTFNASQLSGVPEADIAAALSRKLDDAGDVMFNAMNRGGVTKLVGDTKFASYSKSHPRFSAAGAQPKIGVHKIGSIDGVDIYKAPNEIIKASSRAGSAGGSKGYGYAVYKNELQPEDVSIAFGTLIPLYETPTMEFKSMHKEKGLGYFGDAKVLTQDYIVPMVIDNIDHTA